ncbi:EscU/YscU/HrcU family type III secretion system export apparatus switch protein [Burkholderia stagnalis]|uniref:EscU/YscU/HrcU family type III secretion system export apparatus switch protein n=1 Tax=Burkholderia stagnalis TaxID=1503054 RepID=UPI000F5BB65A|nr:EscU/YscU/HrcU family type III secretion system export apparatus switch protein [Burkholderia stagnalis]RQQ01083.1 flagellar type III secretion system protein FlhB [Burkholderia stagnalis]RQY68698.1 flagellar type III secretion system protein FlhB [Burkholderia stagnalis]
MAEQDENRSEAATAHRLEQARRKGLVPKSQELGMLASLATCAVYLWGNSARIAEHIATSSARALADIPGIAHSPAAMSAWLSAIVLDLVRLIAPITLLSMGAGLLVTVLQTRFLFAPAALKADFSRLNPIQGLRRVVSLQTLFESARTLVKMVVYSLIAWYCIAPVIQSASHTWIPPRRLGDLMQATSLSLLTRLLIAATVFAAIDFAVVHRVFARKMRMSRHEIKQEYKQREGDPRIKSQRRKIRRELFQHARSLRRVRDADVLITNPTHYAIGLKYLPSRMSAPIVIAKGAGDLAQRLKKIAFVYGVPVVESPPLARQIFRETRIDQEISADSYRETAAIYLRTRRQPTGGNA